MYQMKRYGTVTFVCFCFYQLGLCYTANLTRLNLSASCGGMCLNWVKRNPSQLSVPEVPTTVSPKLQPYWLKISTASSSLLEIQDNNSVSGSAYKNLSE